MGEASASIQHKKLRKELGSFSRILSRNESEAKHVESKWLPRLDEVRIPQLHFLHSLQLHTPPIFPTSTNHLVCGRFYFYN